MKRLNHSRLVLGGICLYLLAGAAALPRTGAAEPVMKPAVSTKWQIDYAYAPIKKPEGSGPEGQPALKPFARLQQAVYTITGTMVSIVSTYDDRTTKLAFIINGSELSKHSATGKVRFRTFEDQTFPDLQCRQVFPGFDWLRPEYAQGEEQKFGQLCVHYVEKTNAPAPGVPATGASVNAAPRPREAWVAKETLLPVAFFKEDTLGRYTFQDAPTEPIQLPEEYRAFWQKRFGRTPPTK